MKRFIPTKWVEQVFTLRNPETGTTRDVMRVVPAAGYWIGPGRRSVLTPHTPNKYGSTMAPKVEVHVPALQEWKKLHRNFFKRKVTKLQKLADRHRQTRYLSPKDRAKALQEKAA